MLDLRHIKYKTLVSCLALVLLVVTQLAPRAFALVGPHSYTDSTDQVFLGGDYIELGLSKLGSFGTDNSALPSGFYGTDGHTAIGMSTNPTGFGVAPDLRMDFFMPGSPEERWDVGYKQSGTEHTGSNAYLSGASDISDNTVTGESSGDKLQARSVGTLSNKLKTTQVISFNRGDKFFKNEVTLTNVDTNSMDNVRYMRSFDPDNTQYQGGSYTTHNYIPFTQQAGDGKAVVIADTNIGSSDPVFDQNGSYSPILFYSSDSRARVSTFGFANADPYQPEAYDSALPKGTDVIEDQAISIAFDVGTLAPGASETISYYTSLDNRDFSDVLNDIQSSTGGGTSNSNVPNNGDANNDGVVDSTQTNVLGLVNPITNKYAALQADSSCSIQNQSITDASSLSAKDGAYNYPAGLMNFTLNGCGAAGYTATVTQYYYGIDGSNYVLRKYDSNKKQYMTVPGATVTKTTIDGQMVTKVTYKIQDGGELDEDGMANGVIIDPAGLAAPILTNTGTNIIVSTGVALFLVVSSVGVLRYRTKYRLFDRF